MYVCICNAITDSQVIRAGEQGVRNLRGLQSHLGIALECGRCASYAQGLLRDSGKTQTHKARCGNDCGKCCHSKENQNERRQDNAAVPQ